MKNKWLYALLAIMILSAMVLTACGGDDAANNDAANNNAADNNAADDDAEANDNEPEEDVSVDEPDEPAAPKIVTIAWTQEPDTLNPFYTSMWYSAVLMDIWLCDAWIYDDNNEPVPQLVTEIPSMDNGGLSADGLTITLNLRDDIFWSDGTPITSEDFVFTYDMVMDDANVMDTKYPFDYFAGVEAPDAQTVVVTFDDPFASWEATLWGGIFPKHILGPVFESEGSIQGADWNDAPTVGCGPFVFNEWESGSYVSFAKNENFFDGEALLDEVFFLFVPDDAAQTAAALAGDADIAFWPPYEDIPRFRDAGLDVVTQASGYNEGWFFNIREMASPGIQELDVRKAIAMAIDRETIAQDLKFGVVAPNVTLWDALPAYVSPDLTPWPYDPAAAAQLLEDAGWVDTDGDGIREKDGAPLTIVHGTTTKETRQNVQAIVQEQLRDIGIDLTILSMDGDILFEAYDGGGPAARGELDIMEWSDAPYFPDPDTYYWLCDELPSDEYPWGGNYFVCDETLDQLFQDQIVMVNSAERQAAFHEITKLMHENVYYLGMWEDPDVWIVNPRLSGYAFSGITPFYNIMEWDVTE
jgi:peptide/nickel transport system substrate-binding protein